MTANPRDDTALIAAVKAVIEALEPFGDRAVFNDNGDMSVDRSAVGYDDFVRAHYALRRIRDRSALPRLLELAEIGARAERVIEAAHTIARKQREYEDRNLGKMCVPFSPSLIELDDALKDFDHAE